MRSALVLNVLFYKDQRKSKRRKPLGSREGAHYMANRLPVNLRTAGLAIQYFLLGQCLSLDLVQDLLNRGGDFI